MKKISLLLVGVLCIGIHASAQNNLKKVKGSGQNGKVELYVNEKDDYFSNVIHIAFKKHVTKNIRQLRNIQSSNIRPEFTAFRNVLYDLTHNYGLLNMERLYPDAIPNDTIRYSKKGKRVVVTDLSKIYKLRFEGIWSLEDMKKKLNVPNIRYVEQPPVFYTNSNFPNDPYYNNQWTHKIMESGEVFNITQGDPDIIIGISDAWSTSSSGGEHEDMDGRVIAYQFGKWVSATYSHGPRIALIAAATNNNNKGVASLGGTMKIVTSGKASGGGYLIPGLAFFTQLSPEQRPDVINMSWIGTYNSTTKNILQDLVNMGVILVTATGNDLWWDPNNTGYPFWPGQKNLGEEFIPYPAAYLFNNDEQAISVTATQLTDDVGQFSINVPLDPPFDPFQYEERFRWQEGDFIFNYGLDNDPLNNPDSAFTDVAAPAGWFFTAKGETATNDYGGKWGATSEAAPMVTSVVAMILSVNPDLKGNSQAVYDIITSTTDYDNIVVPQDAQTNTLPDGRKYNKYLGFGRVNAFKAVVAAMPELGGDVVTTQTISKPYYKIKGANLDIKAGATLTIDADTKIFLDENKKIIVRAGAKLIVNGTQQNPVHFKRLDSTKPWGSIVIHGYNSEFNWAVFDGGTRNVDVMAPETEFNNCVFKNADRPISTYFNQSNQPGKSSFSLTNCRVENSSTHGMVVYNADADLIDVTSQNNDNFGLYAFNADVSMRYSVVEDNGSYGIWSKNGIIGSYFGDQITLNNRVKNNGSDQIYLSYGGVLQFGYIDYQTGEMLGGYNSITTNSSDAHINNHLYNTTTAEAELTHWGTSSPNLIGLVNASSPISNDPTQNSGSSNLPQGMRGEGELLNGQKQGTSEGAEGNPVIAYLRELSSAKSTPTASDLALIRRYQKYLEREQTSDEQLLPLHATLAQEFKELSRSSDSNQAEAYLAYQLQREIDQHVRIS